MTRISLWLRLPTIPATYPYSGRELGRAKAYPLWQYVQGCSFNLSTFLFLYYTKTNKSDFSHLCSTTSPPLLHHASSDEQIGRCFIKVRPAKTDIAKALAPTLVTCNARNTSGSLRAMVLSISDAAYSEPDTSKMQPETQEAVLQPLNVAQNLVLASMGDTDRRRGEERRGGIKTTANSLRSRLY